MEILASLRKKYHDARHIAYSYVIGADRQNYRINDDGEPSGTAGRPIYGAINKSGLTNVIVCVVRYFGGIKLGTSRLAKAYRAAAEDALSPDKANYVNDFPMYEYDKETKNGVDYETYWGNVKTSKAVFDAIKAKGFNAVRIPVSWTNHTDAAGNIDQQWLQRVQTVVDDALSDDLYVIINMHHDDYTWLHPVYAEEEAVSAKYVRIWQQIAGHFRDYDSRLLFEGMNEPRMVGSANEWTGGTDEERDVINHLLAKFVSTVRATGGNNSTRALIVTTHAASITDAAVNGLVLPQDNNLIVSIHNYAPWKFTTKEYPNERRFDNKGKEELDRQFSMLYTKFVSNGVPVIIGEFGAENKDNDSDRTAYYSYYVQTAAKYHIPCFIWDNGLSTSYGLLDRTNSSWFSGGIADAAVNALP